MKKLFLYLMVPALLLACGVPTAVAPAVTVPPALPPTDSPLPPVDSPVPPTETTIAPTETSSSPVPNVTCNEVSLYLAPALASGYDCQTIPEVSGSDMPAWGVNPQYTEITLTGYLLSGRLLTPHIDLFPVQRFKDIEPYTVPGRITALQALLAGGALSGELPLLPVQNAAQLFHSNEQVFPFGSGSGLRFVTMYGQDYGPVNNNALFYAFQGLTADGKYWLSAMLPISNSFLPADGSTLPGGESWDEFLANFADYIAATAASLNAQPDSSFTPTLSALDALVASISVKP